MSIVVTVSHKPGKCCKEPRQFVAIPPEQQEIDYPTEQFEQFWDSQLTRPIDTKQGVKLDVDNKGEKLLQATSVQLSDSLALLIANQGVQEADWLTLQEAYALAKAVGYQKSHQNFRVMLLESPKAVQHQLNWGFEVDGSRRSVSSTKNRAIRLRQNGMIAQALKTQSQGQQSSDACFATSSTAQSNPICSTCNKKMCKNGFRKGHQCYYCKPCRNTTLFSQT